MVSPEGVRLVTAWPSKTCRGGLRGPKVCERWVGVAQSMGGLTLPTNLVTCLPSKGGIPPGFWHSRKLLRLLKERKQRRLETIFLGFDVLYTKSDAWRILKSFPPFLYSKSILSLGKKKIGLDRAKPEALQEASWNWASKQKQGKK